MVRTSSDLPVDVLGSVPESLVLPLRIPVAVDEQSADRSSVPLDPIAVSLIVPHTGIGLQSA